MTPETASKRMLEEAIARAERDGLSLHDVNPATGMTRLEHFKHNAKDPSRVKRYIERDRLEKGANRRKVNPMSKAEQGRLWDRTYGNKKERDPMRTDRDIQVIIKDSGSSKPKRQRWDPKKAKKRKGKFVRRKPFGGNFEVAMRKKYGDQAPSLNTETQRDPSRLSRKSRTSRDFEDDVRHLSLSALGRLLRQFHQRGDEAKCHIIEKEIDRRTKSFRGRR